MTTIQAINSSAHGKIKIKANPQFIQSKNKHFAPLVVQEFVNASQEFPIAFIKDGETGQFNAVALLGLKPQENLFFDEKSWQASYIPHALTLYPFVIHQEKNKDNAVLCFDQSSPLVNEKSGEAMFDSQGKQKSWLTAKGEAVMDYVEKTAVTQSFIQLLLANELLISRTLNLNLNNQAEYSLHGLYVIDEEKFNALPDDIFLELRKSGALQAIYALLMSMQRINHLARRATAN